MRRRPRKPGSDEAEINMTPMLDIVFILLIFFIVTATLTREQGIDMRPPPDSAEDPPQNPPPVILIQVDDTNTIFVNNLQTDIERVSARIERFLSDNPRSPVLIDTASEADHGVIVRIWDQAKVVGADAVSIQTPDS